MTERRDARRIRRSLEAWFRAGKQVFHRTRTFDVSGSGLAMFAPSSLEVHERLDLTLRLDEGRYVTLKASTCWRRPAPDPDQCLVGVRFESDCAADRSALQRWLGCQFLSRFAETLAAYSPSGAFRMPAWA